MFGRDQLKFVVLIVGLSWKCNQTMYWNIFNQLTYVRFSYHISLSYKKKLSWAIVTDFTFMDAFLIFFILVSMDAFMPVSQKTDRDACLSRIVLVYSKILFKSLRVWISNRSNSSTVFIQGYAAGKIKSSFFWIWNLVICRICF